MEVLASINNRKLFPRAIGMSNLPGVGTRYLPPLSPIGDIPILLNNNREGASPMNSNAFLA